MSWQKATAPAPKQPTGVRASVKVSRDGRTLVRVTISAQVQDRLFGAALARQRLAVMIGRVDHEGKLRIELHPDGNLTATGGPRGTASVTVNAWGDHITAPQKSAPCTCKWDGSALVIDLPPWASQEAVRARLDAEFGLKKSGGGGVEYDRFCVQ